MLYPSEEPSHHSSEVAKLVESGRQAATENTVEPDRPLPRQPNRSRQFFLNACESSTVQYDAEAFSGAGRWIR